MDALIDALLTIFFYGLGVLFIAYVIYAKVSDMIYDARILYLTLNPPREFPKQTYVPPNATEEQLKEQ